MTFFLGSHFDFFSSKIFFLLHQYQKDQRLSYEASFFLHYGWFLHNLINDFIRTNMLEVKLGIQSCFHCIRRYSSIKGSPLQFIFNERKNVEE